MAKFGDFLAKNKFFQKLKSIKHIEIYALVLVAILVIAIWFWPTKTTTKTVNANQSYTTTEEYCTFLESKLCSVLSDIEGAGNISVMITLDGEIQREIAYSSDTKTNSSSNTSSSGTKSSNESITTSTEPVVITKNGVSEPLVIKETLPNVKGVIVVASGANNVRVKLDILKAVQALLNVSSNQVEIFVKG